MLTLAKELGYFINERERIRKGQHSNDPILKTYRFCNVRREDDRVTRWLKKHWRDPYYDSPNMTAAMVLARMVNWPPTLEHIGFPEEWDPERIVDCIHDVAEKGKAWSGAYVITTCGEHIDKASYVVRTASLVQASRRYSPRPEDTLDSLWTRLRGIQGLGAGFIAAQVVADLKYVHESPLRMAKDWWTWSVPGPGSKRGLNRYMLQPLKASWNMQSWKGCLDRAMREVQPLIKEGVGGLHAQDFQNCLCEFDKYLRAKNGEGRPRSHYRPETAYAV